MTIPGDSHVCNVEPEDRSARALEISATRCEPQPPLGSGVAGRAPTIGPIMPDFSFRKGQDNLEHRLIREAQQKLQSALVDATQTLPASRERLSFDGDSREPLESLSAEFLAWMLQGTGFIPKPQRSE